MLLLISLGPCLVKLILSFSELGSDLIVVIFELCVLIGEILNDSVQLVCFGVRNVYTDTLRDLVFQDDDLLISFTNGSLALFDLRLTRHT